MSLMALVLPLVPLPAGATFHRSRWPAHLTVLANFTSPLTPGDILDRLRPILRSTEPVRGLVGEDAQFGPSGSIGVQLIDSSAAAALHAALLEELQQDVALEAPLFARAGFRPHVTVTSERELRRGNTLTLPHITLADLHRDVAHVSWTQKLGDAETGQSPDI